jgi:hypothetical protein
MPLRTYGTYVSAEQSVRLLQASAKTLAPECRVWGFNPRDRSSSTGAKAFCSGTRFAYLNFILSPDQPEPHFYEAITSDSHARYMIDLDLRFCIAEENLVANEEILGKEFVAVARKVLHRF